MSTESSDHQSAPSIDVMLFDSNLVQLPDADDSKFVSEDEDVPALVQADRSADRPINRITATTFGGFVPETLQVTGTVKPEHMCTGDAIQRLCLYPIIHVDIWNLREDMVSKFWRAQEMDLSTDRKDFLTLPAPEKHAVLITLAFFANTDNSVLEALGQRFTQEVVWPESLHGFIAQEFIETVHVHSYNLMIDVVEPDEKKKLALFQAIKTMSTIRAKNHWVLKWALNPKVPIHQAFFAQAIIEGVGFASSFAIIMWLRQKGICKGITFGNKKIMTDECLHVRFAALHYRKCVNRLPEDLAQRMIVDFVENVEFPFIEHVMPERMKGMNQTMMKDYVRVVANAIMVDQLQHKPPYPGAVNPLPWMETLNMLTASNFFEERPAEYEVGSSEDELRKFQLTSTAEGDFGFD